MVVQVMREVTLLSELQHPNIVHYIESFTEAGSVNMVRTGCNILLADAL